MDFEAVAQNMAPFANRLRELMDADGSKEYFLTAAPQCPYPDRSDEEMLDGAVSFDAIWVQVCDRPLLPSYPPLNFIYSGTPSLHDTLTIKK